MKIRGVDRFIANMGSHSPADSGKMECLKLDLKNHRLNFTECAIPQILSDDEPELVVKVALSGVCGTDLHVIEVRRNLISVYSLPLTE